MTAARQQLVTPAAALPQRARPARNGWASARAGKGHILWGSNAIMARFFLELFA